MTGRDRNRLNFTLPWVRFSSYELVEGRCFPGADATPIWYDPWELREFLHGDAARELVKLGDSEERSGDAVLNWVARWGLLGLALETTRRITYPLYFEPHSAAGSVPLRGDKHARVHLGYGIELSPVCGEVHLNGHGISWHRPNVNCPKCRLLFDSIPEPARTVDRWLQPVQVTDVREGGEWHRRTTTLDGGSVIFIQDEESDVGRRLTFEEWREFGERGELRGVVEVRQLGAFEWATESFPRWEERYFPDRERGRAAHPWLGEPAFWYEYGESADSIAHAAMMLRDAAIALEGPSRSRAEAQLNRFTSAISGGSHASLFGALAESVRMGALRRCPDCQQLFTGRGMKCRTCSARVRKQRERARA